MISCKRNRSSVASAVLRAAEAVVFVDVSMDLVRRGGCVKVDVTWDFARFVVDSSDQCCEERRDNWSRLGPPIVHGQRTAEEGPDGNRPREHDLRRCEAVGQTLIYKCMPDGAHDQPRSVESSRQAFRRMPNASFVRVMNTTDHSFSRSVQAFRGIS